MPEEDLSSVRVTPDVDSRTDPDARPEVEEPPVEEDPELDIRETHQLFMRKARRRLTAAEEFPPGSGGRSVEVQFAMAYLTYARELRESTPRPPLPVAQGTTRR